MDGASAVIAVVSLGIQLAESVQKIRRFVRDFKEAPEELQRFITKIDLLHDIFNNVNALIEQQRDMPSHHGSIPLIESALEAVALSVDRLKKELAHVQGLSDGAEESWRAYPARTSRDRLKGLSKKRLALRSVLCKETVDSLCSKVDESIQKLQIIMSLNSTHLHLANMNLLRAMERREHTILTLLNGRTAESSSSEDRQQTLVVQTQKSQASNGFSIRGNRSTISKYTRHSCCRKLWGYVQFQEEVEYTHHRSRDKEQITRQRWSTVVTLPFLRTFLEWQLLRSYGQVSRSLRYYPRMVDPWLYESSFLGSDGEDPLREALTRRELSPFAVDDEGRTLLHYAALYSNFDLCSMLIQLGVNPEQKDIYGDSPFSVFFGIFTTRTLDTARILVNSQSNLEAADVQELYRNYIGAPEEAELVFSYDMDLSKLSGHQNFQITPLHLALLHFGGGGENLINYLGSVHDPGAWLYLVRKLLRGTVDLHAQCEELFEREWHHRTSQLLTPLQCLLLGSHNPCDGENAAKTWLALLSEAEYDQVAYLTHEMRLHAQDEYTDLDAWYQLPAGTRCFHGPLYQPAMIMFVHLDPPKVWWDWYIEPEFEAYHVLHEFRNFNIHHETPCPDLIVQDRVIIEIEKWTYSWPFCYPDWSVESRPPQWSDDEELNAWKQSSKKARVRLARRAERPTRKLTRSQRRRARRLPGGWIE